MTLPIGGVTAPQRTCVGCRATRRQTALVRCTLTEDGHPIISRTASGRGAWLCADTTTACLERAITQRAFARAWKRSVDTEVTHELRFAFEAMKPNMKH